MFDKKNNLLFNFGFSYTWWVETADAVGDYFK